MTNEKEIEELKTLNDLESHDKINHDVNSGYFEAKSDIKAEAIKWVKWKCNKEGLDIKFTGNVELPFGVKGGNEEAKGWVAALIDFSNITEEDLK